MSSPCMSSAGSSCTCGRTSAGRMTVRTPSRRAASIFSFKPPTASTWPVRVISPERATRGSTGTCVSAESRDGRHGDARRRPFLRNAALGEVHAHLERRQQLVVGRARVGSHSASALVGTEARLRRRRSRSSRPPAPSRSVDSPGPRPPTSLRRLGRRVVLDQVGPPGRFASHSRAEVAVAHEAVLR